MTDLTEEEEDQNHKFLIMLVTRLSIALTAPCKI